MGFTQGKLSLSGKHASKKQKKGEEKMKVMGRILIIIILAMMILTSSVAPSGLVPLALRPLEGSEPEGYRGGALREPSRPLPVGAVRPLGWLSQELTVEAHGLAGHLHRFWTNISNSSWIGGTSDIVLHERLPYWLNGIVPTLFQIPDSVPTTLRQDVDTMIQKILNITAATGIFGPQDPPECYGRWLLVSS